MLPDLDINVPSIANLGDGFCLLIIKNSNNMYANEFFVKTIQSIFERANILLEKEGALIPSGYIKYTY